MKSNQNRGPAVAIDSAIGASCPRIIFRTGVRAMISMFVFLCPFVVNAAERNIVAFVQQLQLRSSKRRRDWDQRHKHIATFMDVREQHQNSVAWRRPCEEIRALKDQLYRENLALRDEVDRASMFEEIVGTSKPLRADWPDTVAVDQLFTPAPS